MLHVEWYHVCWPRLTAKRVEPVVSISWASCYINCNSGCLNEGVYTPQRNFMPVTCICPRRRVDYVIYCYRAVVGLGQMLCRRMYTTPVGLAYTGLVGLLETRYLEARTFSLSPCVLLYCEAKTGHTSVRNPSLQRQTDSSQKDACECCCFSNRRCQLHAITICIAGWADINIARVEW